MPASVRITYFPENLRAFVENPAGPVAQFQQVEANKLLQAATGLIGKRYPGHHLRRGPQLAQSGRIERQQGGSLAVIFDNPIARIHHEGARPHTISPRDPKKGMGRKGPGVVTSWGATKFWTKRTVNHPGSPANPFLLKAARQIGWRPAGALKRGTAGPFPIFRSGTVQFNS